MAINYKHEYVVRGMYTFPIDMLRYDQSFPSSETESYKITDDSRNSMLTGLVVEREISLTHYGSREWQPGRPRWASFRWQVVSHVSRKIVG